MKKNCKLTNLPPITQMHLYIGSTVIITARGYRHKRASIVTQVIHHPEEKIVVLGKGGPVESFRIKADMTIDVSVRKHSGIAPEDVYELYFIPKEYFHSNPLPLTASLIKKDLTLLKGVVLVGIQKQGTLVYEAVSLETLLTKETTGIELTTSYLEKHYAKVEVPPDDSGRCYLRQKRVTDNDQYPDQYPLLGVTILLPILT